MNRADLDCSIEELGRRFRAGETTPSEVVAASFDRIERVGIALGAVADVMGEAEREAARLTDELADGRDRGPLHGVPVVVKELIDVAGHRRRAGTHVEPQDWDDPIALDAPVVARWRDAGGVVVARGRTHEFAWGITSRHPDGTGVVNPLDRTRIAGGSSGGVAALVAAGCAPVGIGTDTGGSIRIPAAFCGVVGWKPAHGRVPIEGVVPLAPSFDTVGPITRSVADALAVDAVIGSGLRGGPDGLDGPGPGADDALSSVAVLVDETLAVPDESVSSAVAGALAAAGISGRIWAGDGALPTAREMVDIYAVLQRAEARSVHRDLLGSWPVQADRYGGDVAARLVEADALDEATIERAARARTLARSRWARAAWGIDVIVSPTVGCGPPPITRPDEVVIEGVTVPLREAVMGFTIPANVLGWPALAVPLTEFGGAGVPPSIQLTVRPGRENLLPALAARLSG